MMTAAWPGVLPTPLHLRGLQRLLNMPPHRNLPWGALVHLDREARADLVWWTNHLTQWNGRPVRAPAPAPVIRSDAATHGGGGGWGAVCGAQATGGRWTSEEQRWHINALELLGGFLCSPVFRQERLELLGCSRDGQHGGSTVREQNGRHPEQEAVWAGGGLVAVVLGPEDYRRRSLSSGRPEHGGGLLVEAPSGIGGVAAQPRGFPAPSTPLPAKSHRPLRHPRQHAAPSVLLMASRAVVPAVPTLSRSTGAALTGTRSRRLHS